jgi:hypothetical protein
LKNNRFACQIWRKFDFSFSFHVVKFSWPIISFFEYRSSG